MGLRNPILGVHEFLTFLKFTCQNYIQIKNIFLVSAGLLDIIDFVRSVILPDQDASADEDSENPYQEALKYYYEETKEYG